MNLPDCIHRGKIMGDSCECYSDHFVGPDYAIRPLSLCTHPCPFINKPNLDREATPPRERRRFPCAYLGRIVSRTDARGRPYNCPSKWTRACEIHGECSLIPSGRNVQHCQTCADYEAR